MSHAVTHRRGVLTSKEWLPVEGVRLLLDDRGLAREVHSGRILSVCSYHAWDRGLMFPSPKSAAFTRGRSSALRYLRRWDRHSRTMLYNSLGGIFPSNTYDTYMASVSTFIAPTGGCQYNP